MSSPRRTGTESSQTRALLLDVTERLMREDGYAAVSSRSVAKIAGVTPALIHYYFPTLDDLFLAVFRRGAEKNLERQTRLLASPQPLRDLWEFSIDASATALLTEFMALANHRKTIRHEIADYSRKFRRQQAQLLASRLPDLGLDLDGVPPAALLFLVGAVSAGLVSEDLLGLSEGHAETIALVDRLLGRLGGDAPTNA
ncbi:TetR/AcrR family transcriptional regulator [Frankia sp. AgB1.9]|uniref:TetR/AcrR family transcriptional regulator n=1 Tax=unclassified Frankia TaxID=2632575 RepID=UPI0019342A9D|nr:MULTISPECIES: TetR/AcrR family transcriptional regulator [unclassified Frankia]MBL7486861.1 TetR/AcrR family transcriptional regulator [Frankia sp. AgW1.1]MBL7547252.1 TetR/AcrR family transcriptional regulator [Frankia sp. AgB1.9]MBL7621501.1 TetR/AcrR family transcriptional regulator [Frankia sp. AgB1.8]